MEKSTSHSIRGEGIFGRLELASGVFIALGTQRFPLRQVMTLPNLLLVLPSVLFRQPTPWAHPHTFGLEMV